MEQRNGVETKQSAALGLRFAIVVAVFALFAVWNSLVFRGVTLINVTDDALNLVQEAKCAFMLTLALSSLVVAVFKNRVASERGRIIVLTLSAIMVSGGTAACGISLDLTVNPMPTINTGLAIAGCGVALSVPFFGRLLTDIGTKATTIAVLMGYLLSAFGTSLIWDLPIAGRFLTTSLIPFCQSGLIILHMRLTGGYRETHFWLAAGNAKAPIPGKLLVVVLLSGFLGSFVRAAMYCSGSEFSTSPSQALIIRLVILTILIVILLVQRGDYDTFSTFWPWVTLPMVLCCVVLPFVIEIFPVAIVAFFSLSHIFLNAFSFTLFVDIAARYKKDVAAIFCWGRTFDSLGCVLGILLGFAFSASFAVSTNLWYMLSMVCSFAIIGITILVLRVRDFSDFPAESTASDETPKPKTKSLHDVYAERFSLSDREADVLVLLGQGRSIPYISKELLISTGTVKTHVASIYKKLDVHNRQELLDAIQAE